MTTLQGSWLDQSIVSNGVKLHYVTQGEGPLMLMMHGFPEFWYSWRHQIPEFARDYKVVALDLRGYNESDKPQEVSAYRMPELLLDVEGVIHGLGYDSAILVGHDWGGAIAWTFAYDYPHLVDRLVVLNFPHPVKFAQGLRTPQQVFRSSYIFLFQIPGLPELLLQVNDYQLLAAALTGMAVNKATFSATDIETYKDAAAKRGALTAMLNYYRANFFQSDLLNREWGMLDVPTLMIWGEKDTALGNELTYGTEEYVEDLTIRYIPNCSHWLQQEQPQLVNQYIREFLSQPK